MPQHTTTSLCPVCGAPIGDTGYLCHRCTALMAGHLDFIAKCAHELDVTFTRRDKLGDGTGRSTEAPLPFNEHAADTARELARTVVGLAVDIMRKRGLTPVDDALQAALKAHPIGSTGELAAAARYIRSHLRWLRAQTFAEAAYTAIEEAARLLARAIDSHPALTDLGPCGTEGCAGRLLATHGARMVRCRECGCLASVAETTGLLLDWARDQLFTAEEIATLISKWSTRRRIPAGTIRSWAARGLLPRKGRDGKAWLYNLGDALDLADRLTPAPATTEQKLAA